MASVSCRKRPPARSPVMWKIHTAGQDVLEASSIVRFCGLAAVLLMSLRIESSLGIIIGRPRKPCRCRWPLAQPPLHVRQTDYSTHTYPLSSSFGSMYNWGLAASVATRGSQLLDVWACCFASPEWQWCRGQRLWFPCAALKALLRRLYFVDFVNTSVSSRKHYSTKLPLLN